MINNIVAVGLCTGSICAPDLSLIDTTKVEQPDRG